MPLFDYHCPSCGAQREAIVLSPVTPVVCVKCDTVMERQPAAPAFAVHGFNAKNGYADTGKR